MNSIMPNPEDAKDSTWDNATLTIGDVDIAAGEKKQLELPVARLVTGNWLSLPVVVINGSQAGPTLFLCAAVHGDELNGVEIIRQVLAKLESNALSGTVLAVPVVNMFGFIDQSRYMPDRRDLNRSFPGSAKGSLTGRLAGLFMTEIVRRCNYGIDLHTGSNGRTNLPQIRADLTSPVTLQLATAFAAPIMINSQTRDGSLRAAAVKQGIPTLLYEAGEASLFNTYAIEAGINGVLNVMKHLHMIEIDVDASTEASLRSDKSRWLRATRSGIFHAECQLGQRVKRRQVLGTISDIFGNVQATSRSSETGIIVGLLNNPLVNQGDALVHVALTEPG